MGWGPINPPRPPPLRRRHRAKVFFRDPLFSLFLLLPRVSARPCFCVRWQQELACHPGELHFSVFHSFPALLFFLPFFEGTFRYLASCRFPNGSPRKNSSSALHDAAFSLCESELVCVYVCTPLRVAGILGDSAGNEIRKMQMVFGVSRPCNHIVFWGTVNNLRWATPCRGCIDRPFVFFVMRAHPVCSGLGFLLS